MTAKTYTFEDYQTVLRKLLTNRDQEMAKLDDQIDGIMKTMVGMLDKTNADQETDGYLLLRNAKERGNGYNTKREERLKEHLEAIGNRLLKRLQDQGVKSMRAGSGTFYKEEVFKPSCADWDVFYKWIAEHNAFEFLEKRVTKKEIVDYLKREKTLPPGISLNSHLEARVRKGADA